MPRFFLSTLLLIFCVGFTACSAPAKSYYILTPEGSLPARGGSGVGVGPVLVAGYIDRPNLVLQESGHRLAVAEDHRWAGKLEENVARVTANNLGRLLGTSDVRTYPWDSEDGLRYQVVVDLNQLHGNAEGDAVIEATWRVYSLPDRRLVSGRSWTGSEALKADGYDELVAAQSRLLAGLAREIADSMK
jgi:hypothetical protein